MIFPHGVILREAYPILLLRLFIFLKALLTFIGNILSEKLQWWIITLDTQLVQDFCLVSLALFVKKQIPFPIPEASLSLE